MPDRTRQPVLFEDTFRKPVHVHFNAEALSSDGGLPLLAALDRKIGLTTSLLSTLRDTRQRGKVAFSYAELFRQRTFGLAMGYRDGINSNDLRHDPMMKLANGRDPLDEDGLASQSTISRFENTPTARQVVGMGRELEKFVIGRLAKRCPKARVVTLDFDSTVDPTHGQQQLSMFNGFYDTHCFLPLLGFISIDGEADQHLFHARLRPGTVRCFRGVMPALRRAVAEVRRRFPKAKIRVRMDAGFYHPRVLDVLEDLRVDYAVGMAKNKVLKAIAEDWMDISRILATWKNDTQTLFAEGDYKAKSWPHSRRVVIKAEVVHFAGRPLKDNQRFVVTNRNRISPKKLYAWYCGRGDSENRIKELKCDLSIDRTSCTRFVANQFRVLMTAAAFVLFQELRWRLRDTRAGRCTVGTIRQMLLKVATRVVSSVRRIVCRFPSSMPWDDVWRIAAKRCGAIAA
jgi:hypothetical protein